MQENAIEMFVNCESDQLSLVKSCFSKSPDAIISAATLAVCRAYSVWFPLLDVKTWAWWPMLCCWMWRVAIAASVRVRKSQASVPSPFELSFGSALLRYSFHGCAISESSQLLKNLSRGTLSAVGKSLASEGRDGATSSQPRSMLMVTLSSRIRRFIWCPRRPGVSSGMIASTSFSHKDNNWTFQTKERSWKKISRLLLADIAGMTVWCRKHIGKRSRIVLTRCNSSHLRPSFGALLFFHPLIVQPELRSIYCELCELWRVGNYTKNKENTEYRVQSFNQQYTGGGS